MRVFIFLVGLAGLVVGVASYFDVIRLPMDYSGRIVTIGTAEFQLEFVLIVIGFLLMLLGFPSKKRSWK